jgi:HEAT repeat protein/predicted MFS family arabinose efflux permease
MSETPPRTESPASGAEESRGITNLAMLRGMRSWTLSSALAAVYSAITLGAYNTGYALHLGATTAQVGLLSAAASWGQTLQLLSPLLIERLPQRRRLCLAAYLLSYGLWLPVALIPWFTPSGWRPAAMIVLLALSGAAAAVAAPASTSWLGDLVPVRMRARFVSRQQMAMAAVGLAASIVAGRYMDAFPSGGEQIGFTVIFLVAVLFGVAAIGAWARVPEPPAGSAGGESPLRLLALPWRNRAVRNLTIFVGARTASVMVAAPFFIVYMLKHLGIPYSLIALLSGASTIAMIAANPIWAYLADKFGYRPVLHISAFGLAFVPATWFFTTKGNYMVLTPVLMLWAGVMAAGVILAQFNLLVKVAPEEHRSVYVGFHSAVVSAASALGAMMGGALGDLFEHVGPLEFHGLQLTNLHLVFAVSAIGRFGCLALLGRIREERAASARVLLDRVSSGHTLATAWGLYRMAHSRDATTKAHSVRALGSAHSRLPVEELINSLEDSDRDVRREAARALGEIGDPQAVRPLIGKAQDETSGISLEALEALGHIPTVNSRDYLIRQLDSEQPAIREVAAVALGVMGAHDAGEPLRRLVDRETHPTVALAAARALGRTAGRDALAPLRELLKRSESDIARRELATALGDLISRPGRLYKLLQMDLMRQDETVERVLRRCRRRLAHLRGMSRADLRYAERELGEAFDAFVRDDYGATLRVLLHVGTRTLKLALPVLPPESAAGSVRDLTRQDDRLQMAYALLSGTAHDALRGPIPREDALLAVVAFQVLIHQLDRLIRG